MRSEIAENQEFNIISRRIDNASKCIITDITKDFFKVKVPVPNSFEEGESVEMFAMTNKGQLYFETFVRDIEEDIVSIWFPISYKYLQRREFSRIQTDQKVELIKDDNHIRAEIFDISAGGLKLKTDCQLELLTDYKVILNIDKKSVETIFEPIRTEALQNCFVSSGRFKNLDNYDRIALVQYCFIKQIENSNK